MSYTGTVTIENAAANPVPVEVTNTSLTVDKTGLATAAKQDTGNASLAAIEVANKPGAGVTFLADITVGGAGGTTPTQLASNAATQGVWVRALVANTVEVRIGGSDVSSSKGAPLSPGDVQFFPVSNSNALYHVSTTTGQKIAVWFV